MTESGRPTSRRSYVGVVVGDKMTKTVVVAVEHPRRHPLYKKILRRTKRYHVHDERGEASLGDTVRIEDSRPYSATKRWRLMEVLARHEVPEVAPEAIGEELIRELEEVRLRRHEERGRAESESPAEASTAPAEAPPEAPAEEVTAEERT